MHFQDKFQYLFIYYQAWVAFPTCFPGKVAEYKELKGGVFFVNEIPKSAAGKILRRVLREQYKAMEDTAEEISQLK